MNTCTVVTLFARLHMHYLQLWLHSAYSPQRDTLTKPVLIPPSVLTSLAWWHNFSMILTGVLFAPHTTLTTDA